MAQAARRSPVQCRKRCRTSTLDMRSICAGDMENAFSIPSEGGKTGDAYRGFRRGALLAAALFVVGRAIAGDRGLCSEL